MNEDLIKRHAEGARLWLQKNRASDQPDTIGQQLLQELEAWVDSGSIEILPSTESGFSMIEENYPVSVNRIDWSRVKDHRMAEFRSAREKQIETDIIRQRLSDFRPQLERWLKELGISSEETVSFIGDDSDITLRMPVAVFLECFPILFEQPQHGYLLPANGKWCLNYTMESELFLGETRNAVVKGWIEE